MGIGLPKNKVIELITLLSGAFIVVLNMTLLTPALKTIMIEMNVDQNTVQWLTSGYSLTEAVIIPTAAFLMGRFNNKKLFLSGLGIFAFGSLLGAIAPTFPILLASRIIQASATGFMMPMVTSIILVVIPKENRGSAMGIITLIIGFAPMIGPTLSGVLIDWIGWRAIFVLVSTLALVNLVVAIPILKIDVKFDDAKFDLFSVILSSSGLILLLLGISSLSSSHNFTVNLVQIACGAVLIAIYAKRQLRSEEPMLKISVLKVKQYRTGVLIVALFQAGLIGMETIMPLYIQTVLGQPATISGLTLLPGTIIGALTGLLAGRLFDKHGVRLPVLCGVTMTIVGLALLLMLGENSQIWFVTLAYACLAIGIDFTMTPVNTWGINSLSNKVVQHAQSTGNTINQVAGSFGTATLVSIASVITAHATITNSTSATFAGYHGSLIATAIIVGLALVVIVFRVKGETEEANTESCSPSFCVESSK